MTINTWLLSAWTFPSDPRYLRSLNLSELRDAQLFIRHLAAGVFIRESKKAREYYSKSLYTATNPTTTAADTFIKKIDLWILELLYYAKTCLVINPKSKKMYHISLKLAMGVKKSPRGGGHKSIRGIGFDLFFLFFLFFFFKHSSLRHWESDKF